MIHASTIAWVLGAVFFVGIAMAVRTALFVRRAVRLRARVVQAEDVTVSDHDTSTSSASTTSYVVEISGEGRKRRVKLADTVGGALTSKLVAADDTIAVLYDPDKPQVVRIDSLPVLYFIPAFLCIPGLLFGGLVLYVWIAS